jgi:hypothetical protein
MNHVYTMGRITAGNVVVDLQKQRETRTLLVRTKLPRASPFANSFVFNDCCIGVARLMLSADPRTLRLIAPLRGSTRAKPTESYNKVPPEERSIVQNKTVLLMAMSHTSPAAKSFVFDKIQDDPCRGSRRTRSGSAIASGGSSSLHRVASSIAAFSFRGKSATRGNVGKIASTMMS